MISRVKRSKFWRHLARGAPVFLAVLILLGSMFCTTAAATDTEGGNVSFYNMSSIGAGFLNDMLARNGVTSDGEEFSVSVASCDAGGLLGYCDALDEDGVFTKWLHSQFSNSAVSFSHDSFLQMNRDSGNPANVQSLGLAMHQYCKYGQLLSMIGFDMAGESGLHPVRLVGGFLMRGIYTLATFVPRLFEFLVGVLVTLNPFRFFNSRSNLSRIDDLDYYATATDGTSISIKNDGGGLGAVGSLLTSFYDFMYEHFTLIVLTIAFVILVTNLIFSSNKQAFKKIKAYVMRVIIMFLIVPLCAMIYTETLDKLNGEINLGLSYGTSRVVMSTFMDFENWARHKQLRVATNTLGTDIADLQIDCTKNRPVGSTILNLRTSCYNINANVWSSLYTTRLISQGDYLGGIGNAVGGLFSVQPLYTDSTTVGASDSVLDFNSSSVGTANHASTQGEFVTEMVNDLLERYQKGTFYYSSNWESDFKAANQTKASEIAEIAQATGKTVKNFDESVLDYNNGNLVWTSDWPQHNLTTSTGDIYDFSRAGELSPMALYNYLSSSFDEANVQVYSNEKSSSGFIRDSHFSVTLIGASALDQFLYWLNAFTLLGCIAVLGLAYAMAVIFCNLKRSFLMYPEIITTTFGSLRAGARLVGHTFLLIVEVIITILVYCIACEFLMAMNDIVCNDLIGGMARGSAGVIASAMISMAMLVSTVCQILLVLIALKARKSIVKTIDEAVTSLVDKLFGVQHLPEPDTPGLGSRLAGGLATGAGAGIASRLMGGGGDDKNARGTATADEDNGGAGGNGNGEGGNGGGGSGGSREGGEGEAHHAREGEEAAAQADTDVPPADSDSLPGPDVNGESGSSSEDASVAESLENSESLSNADIAAAAAANNGGGDGGSSSHSSSSGSGDSSGSSGSDGSSGVGSDGSSGSDGDSGFDGSEKSVEGAGDDSGGASDAADSDGGAKKDAAADADKPGDTPDTNTQGQTKGPQAGDSSKNTNPQASSKKNSGQSKKGSGKKGAASGDKKDDGDNDSAEKSSDAKAKAPQAGDKAGSDDAKSKDAAAVTGAAAVGAAAGAAAAAAAKMPQAGDKAGGDGSSGAQSGGAQATPVAANADGSGGAGSDAVSAVDAGSGAAADADTSAGGAGDSSDAGGSDGGTRDAVPTEDGAAGGSQSGSKAGTKTLGGSGSDAKKAAEAAAAAAAATTAAQMQAKAAKTPGTAGSKAAPGTPGAAGGVNGAQAGANGAANSNNAGNAAASGENGKAGAPQGGVKPVAAASSENGKTKPAGESGHGSSSTHSSGHGQSGDSKGDKAAGAQAGASGAAAGASGASGQADAGAARTKAIDDSVGAGAGSGSGNIEHGENHGPSQLEQAEPMPKGAESAAADSKQGSSGAARSTASGAAPVGNKVANGTGKNAQSGVTGPQANGKTGSPGGAGQNQGQGAGQSQGGQSEGDGVRAARSGPQSGPGGQSGQSGSGSAHAGQGKAGQSQGGRSVKQGGQSAVHQTPSENPVPQQESGQAQGQAQAGSESKDAKSGAKAGSQGSVTRTTSHRPSTPSGPSRKSIVTTIALGEVLSSSGNPILSGMGRGMSQTANAYMYQSQREQGQGQETRQEPLHTDAEKKELDDKATDVIKNNKKQKPKKPGKPKKKELNLGRVKDSAWEAEQTEKREQQRRIAEKNSRRTEPHSGEGGGKNVGEVPQPPPGGLDDDMLL